MSDYRFSPKDLKWDFFVVSRFGSDHPLAGRVAMATVHQGEVSKNIEVEAAKAIGRTIEVFDMRADYARRLLRCSGAEQCAGEGMKPYYQQDGVTIYHGDCREVLPSLEADSVGLALTDPPYNVGKNYGEHDDQQEHQAFLLWLGGILGQCSRVSQDGVVYFPGQVMRNVLGIGSVLEVAGIEGYRLLGWHKKEFAGDKWHTGPAFCWEPIVWASKQPRPFFNKRFGHAGRDFLVVNATHGDPFKKSHPCPKPLPVMKWLVGLFALDGMPVLDPFMGTGTTLRAAKDAGLSSIGIEQNERYCESAVKRLAQGVLFAGEVADEPA